MLSTTHVDIHEDTHTVEGESVREVAQNLIDTFGDSVRMVSHVVRDEQGSIRGWVKPLPDGSCDWRNA